LRMAPDYTCTTLGRPPVRVWFAGWAGGCRAIPAIAALANGSAFGTITWSRKLPFLVVWWGSKGRNYAQKWRGRGPENARHVSPEYALQRLHCSQRSALCGPLFWTSTSRAASQAIQLGDSERREATDASPSPFPLTKGAAANFLPLRNGCDRGHRRHADPGTTVNPFV
jgi:hypothetical protein